MVPLLKFFFHEDVRRSAIQSLPEMLTSAHLAAEKGLHGATKQTVKQLLDFFWPALMEGLSKVCLQCVASFSQSTTSLSLPEQKSLRAYMAGCFECQLTSCRCNKYIICVIETLTEAPLHI